MVDFCLYIYHKNQANIGKYTSPMDGMGMISKLSYSGVLCQVIEDSSQGEAEACLGNIEEWQWVRKYGCFQK